MKARECGKGIEQEVKKLKGIHSWVILTQNSLKSLWH